jgi:hypothetical protein
MQQRPKTIFDRRRSTVYEPSLSAASTSQRRQQTASSSCDILRTVQEQRALEVAPRSVDPIQQTVATVLQSYLNHPDVNRGQTIEVIRFLNQPMLKVQVDALRKAYKAFQSKREIKTLLAVVAELREQFGEQEVSAHTSGSTPISSLKREDLKLICFDFISGG